jgi:small subunit ribosomal protein S21
VIVINVKEQESIDQALKRYKRKHKRVGIIKEIRNRKHFTKKSVQRRNQILNAKYRDQYLEEYG